MKSLNRIFNELREGRQGEICAYCGTGNSREEGSCAQCGAPMERPLCTVFGVPVYDPFEFRDLMQELPGVMVI